jgi:hypothetical protein
MVVRRVGPLSLAKVTGLLYALLGLIIGACISLFSFVGSSMGPKGSGAMGAMFGVAAIIIFPIFYGILGFIMSLISAALYNLVAGWVGGVELDMN